MAMTLKNFIREVTSSTASRDTNLGFFVVNISLSGVRRSAFGCGIALQPGRLRVRFPIVSLEFFVGIILPVALWPWG